jgi:Outer membrane protein beta-barrel domain
MLRKSLYGVLTASLLVVGAQSAKAQLLPSLHFNVNAGASMPMSDAGDVWNAGFRVGGGVEFRAPVLPVGLRIDGAYDRMGLKLDGSSKLSILSGTANAVFTLPLMPIYAVGGIGMYRSDAGAGSTSTDFGFNAGLGLRLPLPMLSPFVEARFNQINGDGGNFRYVPIVAGIRF